MDESSHTGAPGAGKTAIRQLELDGFSVVEEAASDVIAAAQAQGAQPWTHPSFIDVVANLQRNRRIRASYPIVSVWQPTAS